MKLAHGCKRNTAACWQTPCASPIRAQRLPETTCICQIRIRNSPCGSGTSSGGRLSPVLSETIRTRFPQTLVAASSSRNPKGNPPGTHEARAMPETTIREQKWYALTVPYQHERQTEKLLQSQGLETLVPLYRARRQWSARVKEVEMPLFAGYVLCQFDLTERIQVLDTPGVS